jgi:hypothetical protein
MKKFYFWLSVAYYFFLALTITFVIAFTVFYFVYGEGDIDDYLPQYQPREIRP